MANATNQPDQPGQQHRCQFQIEGLRCPDEATQTTTWSRDVDGFPELRLCGDHAGLLIERANELGEPMTTEAL